MKYGEILTYIQEQKKKTMNPTQKQIDAALRYADQDRSDESTANISCDILATVYRELQGENNRLKSWADWATSQMPSLESFRRKP